ncbi:PGF-CTERM-anchored ABC transporter substrate-binding protein [Halorientalis sp.]|uniref:PGF-CTERM-anchored ABC transporter substrate-binding protein n=1 Tax=Halorientalis sp. TaxID=1931229 RepID=UPI0026167445|nr:PGF-CTERM-anchored ABC transporter substrate-binding protein [Halorientalis sp.]
MHTRTLVLTAVLLAAGGLTATGAVAGGPPVDSVGPAIGAPVGQQAAVTQGDCTFPVTRTDVTGTDVTVDQQPERVVALQPSDAQILWEVGARDRAVGVPKNQYTSYLNRSGTADVSGEGTVEKVVGTDPDLVLAANITDPETVEALRGAGLTVYHFAGVESLDGIARNVETVGRLVGSCESARSEADEFRLAVERARQAHANASDRPSVLYTFFGYTTGTGTHIHEAVEAAGGENVAVEAGLEGYRELSDEVVLDRDPAWIVYPDDYTLPGGTPYNETTAVQQNQTIALDYSYINQPGPRVAIPLTQLAKAWHPEGLAEANRTVNGSDVPSSSRTTASTTSGNGPGFGVAVALLALLLTALVTARRD